MSTGELVCEECGARPAGRGDGWRALLVDIDDDGQDGVVSYCPACAWREFGALPQSRQRRELNDGS